MIKKQRKLIQKTHKHESIKKFCYYLEVQYLCKEYNPSQSGSSFCKA